MKYILNPKIPKLLYEKRYYELGMNLVDFEKKSGINKETIRMLEKGIMRGEKFSPSTLQKISKILKIKISDIYIKVDDTNEK